MSVRASYASGVSTSVRASGANSGSDSDDMPPLISAGDSDADDEQTRSLQQQQVDAQQMPLLPPPTPAPAASPSSWFAFASDRARCVPGYTCCLRYSLRLASCCMPRAAEFRMLPSHAWLQSRFYPLHADADTLAFLRECERNFFERGWISWWGMRVAVLKPWLRRCMAHTDVNGLLGCGQMFLTSAEQVRTLLQQSIPDSIRGQRGVEWPWSRSLAAASDGSSAPRRSRLLDVGAGDGNITAFLSRFFDETVTTEVAPQMVKRLRARGWQCAHTADLDEGLPVGGALAQEGFDLVALFNVLDRCAKPRTLLAQILRRMRAPGPDGINSSRLLLSVPLPLDPSVESGTRWVEPEERILAHSRGQRDFESSACALADMLLEAGFNIESFARLPYLSQGDTHRPFYVLDCSLWMLSKRQPGEPLPKQEAHQQHAHNGHAHAHGSGTLPTTLTNLAAEVD